MPRFIARIGCALVVLFAAVAASAQSSFDIKTVDPETFRAIAFKIGDAQRPDVMAS